MFEDPAYPSMPPPGQDDSVKPMSLMAAALWAAGAHLAYLWLAQLLTALRPDGGYDPIGFLLCQVAGYTTGLYMVLRVYGPETRIRDLLALRPTSRPMYPLAVLLGAAATAPAAWLAAVVRGYFPPDPQVSGVVDAFYRLGRAEQIAVAFGIIFVGPFVEEMLFRGALFRPLCQRHKPVVVIFTTALLFTAIHPNPQDMPSLLLMGLALGYLRWASGSLLPPLLLHMTFNTVPFLELFSHEARPQHTEVLADSTAAWGLAICSAALLGIYAVGRHSRRASGARRCD